MVLLLCLTCEVAPVFSHAAASCPRHRRPRANDTGIFVLRHREGFPRTKSETRLENLISRSSSILRAAGCAPTERLLVACLMASLCVLSSLGYAPSALLRRSIAVPRTLWNSSRRQHIVGTLGPHERRVRVSAYNIRNARVSNSSTVSLKTSIFVGLMVGSS